MPLPQVIHEAGKDALLVAAPSLRELASSLLESATGNLRNRLKTWGSDRHLNRLAQKLHDARMVKTLWSFDQRVDLLTFYYPQQLRYFGRILKVDSIDDLRKHDSIGVRVAIAGHLGLGKSILARYLTLNDLAKGRRIPLLIELRKLAGKSLFSEIRDALLLLDIDADKDVVRYLLKIGKLALVLDGFDEVPLERRQKLIRQIDKIAARYPQADMVITSRPGTEVFTLYEFSRADLSPLDRKDLEPLIHRLMEDPK